MSRAVRTTDGPAPDVGADPQALCDPPRRRGRTSDLALPLSGLVLAAVIAGQHADLQLRTVESGSMAPALPAGSLLLERAVPIAAIRAGDVVTYSAPTPRAQVVSHRVTSVRQQEDGTYVLRTRGDANPGDDPWEAAVSAPTAWRVVGHLPDVGRLLSAVREAVQSDVGLALGTLTGLALVWSRPRPPRSRWCTRGMPRRGPGPVARARTRRTIRSLAVIAVLAALSLPVLLASGVAFAAWTASAARGHAVRTVELLAPTATQAATRCLLGGNVVTIGWTLAADQRTGLRVERRTAAGPAWTVLASLPPGATSYEDSSTAVATRYDYRVVATAPPWFGPPSGELQVNTLPSCV